ncbi:hypothetical protein BB559_002885, partial [Furculomyces boomerangus]
MEKDKNSNMSSPPEEHKKPHKKSLKEAFMPQKIFRSKSKQQNPEVSEHEEESSGLSKRKQKEKKMRPVSKDDFSLMPKFGLKHEIEKLKHSNLNVFKTTQDKSKAVDQEMVKSSTSHGYSGQEIKRNKSLWDHLGFKKKMSGTSSQYSTEDLNTPY